LPEIYSILQHSIRSKKNFPKWAFRSAKNFKLGNKTLSKDKVLSCAVLPGKYQTGDHYDCSGLHSSCVLSYGKTSKNAIKLKRHVIFPLIKLETESPTSNFSYSFKDSINMYLEDTKIVNESPVEIKIKGTLTIISQFMNDGARIIRTFSPSPNYPALIEKIEVVNRSKDTAMFSADEKKRSDKFIKSSKLTDKSVSICSRLTDANGDFRSNTKVSVKKKLVPNASAVCYVVHFATKKDSVINFNAEREMRERIKLTDQMFKSVVLYSDDVAVDSFFSHCLLHGCENIFNTKNGLLHFSGAGFNYNSISAIEQCGIVNPIFPLIDYQTGIKQAINSYKYFGKNLMDNDSLPDIIYGNNLTPALLNIQGSLQAFASGLARFLLTYGSKEVAEEFLPILSKAATIISQYISSQNFDDHAITDKNTLLDAYDALIHIYYLKNSLGIINDIETIPSINTLLKGFLDLKQLHSKANNNSDFKLLQNMFVSDTLIEYDDLVKYVKHQLFESNNIYPEFVYTNKQTSSASDAMAFVKTILDGMFGLDPISFSVLRVNPKLKGKLIGLKYAQTLFEVDNTDGLKIKISAKSYPSDGKTDFDFNLLTWK
jgi:hypothetical protein